MESVTPPKSIQDTYKEFIAFIQSAYATSSEHRYTAAAVLTLAKVISESGTNHKEVLNDLVDVMTPRPQASNPLFNDTSRQPG